jgi:hypothetical protein
LEKGGSSVAYDIIRIDGAVLYVRISGVMRLADQSSLQDAGMKLMARGQKVRIHVTLEHFRGWEKGVDWGDVDFFLSHGNDVSKIALVGDERWKEQLFAFLGKGFRTTEIEMFPASSAEEAESWVHA